VEKQKERKVKALKALCAMAVLLLFGVRGSEGVGLTGNGGYDAALFQADYIQDLTEFSSGFVNPALLYRVNQLRLELGIYRWNFLAEGSMGFQELSFLYPHRLNHTFGISVIGTGTSLRRAIVDNLGSIGPDSLNSIASYDDIWTVLHYSWRVLPWFVVGTNVKFRYERQFEDNATETWD
jgi:hypothetical protein